MHTDLYIEICNEILGNDGLNGSPAPAIKARLSVALETTCYFIILQFPISHLWRLEMEGQQSTGNRKSQGITFAIQKNCSRIGLSG